MGQGYFITLEGPDGSGKTTQLKLLAAALSAQHDVVTLRQPGGTALGEQIRQTLLDSRTETSLGPVAPLAELALMFADRAQSLSELIHPALAQGAIVLCDRYTDSSEAYQGAGRGLGMDRIQAIHQLLCDGLQPDLTILLLPPFEACLERARTRNHTHLEQVGTNENRFEQQDVAFHERVYLAYQKIAAREPERVVTFSDPLPVKQISEQVLTTVRHRLELA